MSKLWRFFWSNVWDACEMLGVSLGPLAPWVFAQAIGCRHFRQLTNRRY
jgi:hypothetical protein